MEFSNSNLKFMRLILKHPSVCVPAGFTKCGWSLEWLQSSRASVLSAFGIPLSLCYIFQGLKKINCLRRARLSTARLIQINWTRSSTGRAFGS